MSIGNGIFSGKVFHDKIYDTGPVGSATQPSPEDLRRHQILREDEELMLFIAAIESAE
jgi:hypothetical protein